jgi:tetratricopeptide (TPR) repeat protein
VPGRFLTTVAFLFFAPLLVAAEDCPALLASAQKAFDAKQFAAAAAELESALGMCPQQRVRIRTALGQTYYLLAKDAEAEQSLLAALAAEPNHEEALYALGRVYAMQNRFPEAVEKLETVTRINPKNYKAWDNLGTCYDALNRDADALRSFFNALDLVTKDHPEYDWAHANLADFFLRRNEHEKAFQLAAEAAQRNPQSARNCFLTAKALVRLNKHDLSLRWLERAIELDPQYSDALYLLGQTYRKLGREPEAAQALARFQTATKTRTGRR